MESTKILYVSQEIAPYLPDTGMSLISRHLPQGIQDRGKEIRTFMPRFGTINERRNQLHEVIRLSGMNIIIDDTDHPLIIKVASIQAARMQVYFIDNEDYFHRKHILQEENGDYFKDNDERAIFFARGVLETVKKLRWAPDIVHCHGWFTSIIPLYIKKVYKDDPTFMNTKVVYSAYDDEFQEPLNKNFKKKVLLEGISPKDTEVVDHPDFINVSKLAIENSDAVILGSEKINDRLKSYLITTDKPVLEYQSQENYLDAYSEFYDSLIMESVNGR